MLENEDFIALPWAVHHGKRGEISSGDTKDDDTDDVDFVPLDDDWPSALSASAEKGCGNGSGHVVA